MSPDQPCGPVWQCCTFLHLYITLQARSAIVAQTFCHSQEPGRCGRNSTAIWRLRWGRGPFAVGGKPGFAMRASCAAATKAGPGRRRCRLAPIKSL